MTKMFYYCDNDTNEEHQVMIGPMGNKNVIWIYRKYHNELPSKNKWDFTSEESIIRNKIVWHNKNRYSDNLRKYAERIIRNIAFL